MQVERENLESFVTGAVICPKTIVPERPAVGLAADGILHAEGVAHIQMADPNPAVVAVGIAGIASMQSVPVFPYEETVGSMSLPPMVGGPLDKNLPGTEGVADRHSDGVVLLAGRKAG